VELQIIFYLMGIIYMSIMFVFMIAALIIVLAIKRRIDRLQRTIEGKIHVITSIAHIGEELISKAKHTFTRQ
jgi:uncharacterized protein YoxC